MRNSLFVIIVILSAFFSMYSHAAAYSAGTGTSADPYQIVSVADWQTLMATSTDWNKYFALTADINLSGVTVTPIGNATTHFSGTFDGNGHIISHVVMNTPDISYTGLFGWVDYTGQILNLGVENVNILGQYYVGGLVGLGRGTISLCHVTGTVASTANNVGGLVGENDGTITSCYAACTVSGWACIGGFAGVNQATITFSYATGAASGGWYIGGMAGIHYGTMTSCYATGPVSISVDGGIAGGLIGYNQGSTTTSCYATGAATGTNVVGGAIGEHVSGTVNSSFWDIQTSGQSAGTGSGIAAGLTGKTSTEMQTLSTFSGAGWDFVTTDGDALDWKMPASGYPRLAWEMPFTNGIGTSADPYQIASVADWQTFMATSITWNKYFILTADIDLTGITVTPVGNTRIKDFGGTFDGQRHVIRNVTINMPGNSSVGLFGWTDGPGQIKNLTLENVNIQGNYYVGGLVGANLWNRPITACYVTGTIQGTSTVGGLAGWNYSPITSCYTACTITGTGNQIGGLVGQQVSTTTNCYATGAVTGLLQVGGLAGWNRAAMTNCYAAGTVTGLTMAGGVVGNNASTVSNSFWDTNLCGRAGIGGGTLTGVTGLTTAQMQTESTFTNAGWDFSAMDGDAVDWETSAGNYPHLAWEPFLPYSGGSGTAEDPYRISYTVDWQRLMSTSADWNKYFILATDIDLAGITVTPVGNAGVLFTGVFEGNGHTIGNVTINMPASDYVGLFGTVGSSGQIKNLGAINVSIQGNNTTGGLAGYNAGIITSCYTTGAVNGNRYVGGLIGYSYGGMITVCYATGTVTALASDVGGLTGYIYGGTVISCYATGSSGGSSNIGGLIGSNEGTVNSSFWDTQTSGLTASAGGTGKTTVEMKTLLTFADAGWDFSASDGDAVDWEMTEGSSYPHLAWESFLPYSGGSGTAEDPYKISSIADWQKLMKTTTDWSKSFILAANIDFAGTVVTPTGSSGTPFTGTFDGNNHILSNIDILMSGSNNVGLFGYIGVTGQIKNLGLWNVDSEGASNVGTLAGNNSGAIISCYVDSGSVTGLDHIGGLAGVNSAGSISNCYASVSCSGVNYAAGLVGTNNQGKIMDCFSTGKPTGTSLGGLCAAVTTGGDYEDTGNFWDTDTSQISTSAMGTGRTTAEMKTFSTFADAGWDFSDADGDAADWHMPTGGYPRLTWLPYDDGNGTAENPYKIASVCDWQRLMNTPLDWDKCFLLAANTDLNGITVTPIGTSITPFTGIVDGGGYTLSNITINTSDNNYVGLFGYLSQTSQIKNLTLENVNIHGRYYVGGLAAYSKGTIISCSVTGTVSAAYNYAGGLVGYSKGTITSCFAACMVSGDYDIGGLVGVNDENGIITSCHAAGNVTGLDNVIGGLAGGNFNGSITSCYATGTVNGTRAVGGLVGNYTGGAIASSYASGNVSGNNTIGGLIGNCSNGLINLCYATGDVSAADYGAGGLLGDSYEGTITSCYATGNVTATSRAGGLVGQSSTITITSCHACGAVTGTSSIGGLIGYSSGTITASYAKGAVTGSSYVGGLVGENNYATFTSCYAMGNVLGWGNYIGGLAGYNSRIITSCYAIGSVVGQSGATNVGGLVGYNHPGSWWIEPGVVNSSFWDTQTTGQAASSGGTGKTTAQMKTCATFTGAGWDFVGETANGTADIWKMGVDGSGYPHLTWEIYSGGSGTAQDPYQIACVLDWQKLMSTPEDWSKCFILNGDINLTGITVTPVGNSTANFIGIFDGNGHKISDAVINTTEGNISLFGYVGSTGQIKNLGSVNGNIQGGYGIGGLVGRSAGTIIACYTTGTVSGTGCIGGLIGQNDGTLIACYSACTASGNDAVGGLAGANLGTINTCYAVGAVTGSTYAGGLAGYDNNGSVNNSFWDTQTSGQASSAGGTGKTTAEMKILTTFTDAGWDFSVSDGDAADWWMSDNSYPDLEWNHYNGDGSGTAADPYRIFTVAHWQTLMKTTADWDKSFILMADINLSGVTMTPVGTSYNTRFRGTLEGNGHTLSNIVFNASTTDYIGLFGYLGYGSRIQNLSLTSINIQGKSYVGGLAGYNDGGTVTSCYVNGAVKAYSNYAGGLIGYSTYGTITSCHTAGTVNATGYDVGGLAGSNMSAVTSCYSQSAVSGNKSSIGGLIGYNISSLTACYATGSVTGNSYNQYVGGLVGDNSGTLSFCYATGAVIGDDYVGGLVGDNSEDMICCYATGSVRGYYYVGGLVGSNGDVITSCYSTGSVVGDYGAMYVGGLVGYNQPQDPWFGGKYGIVNSSFWNTATSGQSSSSGGTGITTAQMQTLSTFTDAGWDFVSIDGDAADWEMPASSYPRLAWENLVPYSGGTGTTEYPYQIASVADWQLLMTTSAHWNKNFILAADLNLHGITVTPVGNYGSTAFTGTFDGNGHIISNVVINTPGSDYVGVFGYIGTTGQVKKLGVLISNIQSRNGGGGVAGRNAGTITSCYAAGTISGSSFIGGLVGVNDGTILTCYTASTVTGSSDVGGLVGNNQQGTMTECYATGSVTGGNNVAGLVGTNYQGKVIDCYSTGKPAGSSIGGLCGSVDTGGAYEDTGNFWDTESSEVAVSAMGTGKTSAQMKTLSTFINAGWDFVGETTNGTNDLWKMEMEGVAYPTLFWQIYSGGSGTAQDPYKIASLVDWQKLMTTPTDWDSCFILMADMDFAAITVTPVGNYGTPYTGTFDGNGHSIRNIIMNIPDGVYVGLFGYVGTTGQIKNMGVQNVNVTGLYYVGGLAGVLDGTMTSCFAAGTVNGNSILGGLVGINTGTLNTCYATGFVQGVDYVGGLVGYNNKGKVIHCYSTAIPAGSTIGGLCGVADTSGGYEDTGNFWDMDSSLITTSAMGIGKTTIQTQTLSTFTDAGWDFAVIDGDAADWMMLRENEDYPRLIWQTIYPADIAGLYGVDLQDLTFLAQNWLAVSKINADIVDDSAVNLIDWSVLSNNWMMTECGQCNGADLSGDGNVDMEDLTAFMNQWLFEENANAKRADMNQDGIVDLGDLAILSAEWMIY